MKPVDKETLAFSSGRKWEDINNGYIGINSDLETCEGYDNEHFFSAEYDWAMKPLTKGERVELADYMISLWERFKNA